MVKHTTDADLDLLAELGVDTAPAPKVKRTPREERIIAGFEEIERFVTEQGRLPQHGEDRDIFERLYAVRLDCLRNSEECRTLLEPLDSRGILKADTDLNLPPETDLDDEALLASLGVEATPGNDINQLTHVRSRSVAGGKSRQEIKAAEEIAQRTPCQDFKQFKPIFKKVQQNLETGARETLKYRDDATVNQGDFFILDGQKLIVADLGEPFISDYGKPDRRLRVIYDNGTESNLLLRSLQRALNKDKTSRRITNPDFSSLPLFAQTEAEDDITTGYIYVLRSKSDDPFIVQNYELVHKIGVTVGDVKKRIANAKKDPTYLLAKVEIVATFKLATINPKKLEALLHKFFDNVRLDMELRDRFGIPVQPREWFLVPLEAIEEVIAKIKAGTIDQFRYDPETASLTRS
ncbi:GIY-YIG nuclease family protein [Coleofasciculus chthonoplastes]|uniref:GIY-YIG nuclease family protein n=1 Tax=Coleofasciculus chthonoplastes TaxID=64178 RepID=UPI0032FC1B46